MVAESWRGVGVKTKPVLRSHRLTIATTKAKAIFRQVFRRWIFLGGFRGAGWLHRAIYGTCLLLTLYRGESYTYTGDLSTEELTLSIEGHGGAREDFKHRPSCCS